MRRGAKLSILRVCRLILSLGIGRSADMAECARQPQHLKDMAWAWRHLSIIAAAGEMHVFSNGQSGVGCGGGLGRRHLFVALFDAMAAHFFSPTLGAICLCRDRLVAVAPAPGGAGMVCMGLVQPAGGVFDQVGAIPGVVVVDGRAGGFGLFATGHFGGFGPIGGLGLERVGVGVGGVVLGEPWRANVHLGGAFMSALFAAFSTRGALDRRGGLVADCPAVGLATDRHGAGPFANALDVGLRLNLACSQEQFIPLRM